jgi:hypothetical protein
MVIEGADSSEVAVDGLRSVPFSQEMFRVGTDLLVGNLLDGHCKPAAELTEDVQIIFYRMDRIVPSL